MSDAWGQHGGSQKPCARVPTWVTGIAPTGEGLALLSPKGGFEQGC